MKQAMKDMLTSQLGEQSSKAEYVEQPPKNTQMFCIMPQFKSQCSKYPTNNT